MENLLCDFYQLVSPTSKITGGIVHLTEPNFINLPGSSDGQSQTLRSAMCTGLPDLATKIFS